MNMLVFTYQNGVCVEFKNFKDILKALIYVEGLRGLADKFSIYFPAGTTLFGTYREGKGNLGLYEI